MKKFKSASFLLAGLVAVGGIGALVACSPEPEPHDPVAIAATKAYAIVQGYEWGPAVPKVVLEFNENVSGFTDDAFAVSFTSQGWFGPQKTKRTVTAVYNSDENGNKSNTATKYMTVEMSVKYNECSPFTYDMTSGRNSWAESIDFTVTVNSDKSFKVGNTTYLDGDSYTYSAKKAVSPFSALPGPPTGRLRTAAKTRSSFGFTVRAKAARI